MLENGKTQPKNVTKKTSKKSKERKKEDSPYLRETKLLLLDPEAAFAVIPPLASICEDVECCLEGAPA